MVPAGHPHETRRRHPQEYELHDADTADMFTERPRRTWSNRAAARSHAQDGGAVAERYPRVTVESVITPTVLDLHAEQIDVAFRFGFGLADSALVARRLLDVEVALVASPRYLREHTPAPRRMEDLRAHRVLFASLGHEPKWRATGGADAEALFRMPPAMSSSDMGFTRELALDGGGIAVLPSASVAHDVDRGDLVRVLTDAVDLPKGALYLVHKKTRVLDPKVRAFRDVIVPALRNV